MSSIRRATSEDYPALAIIWREAVSATHDFLAAADFEFYASRLPRYLKNVDLYVCCTEENPEGFLGVSSDNIEMLFVGRRGKGIGKRLLDFATGELGTRRVDVNRQNKQALDFYEHYGFKVTGESPLDSERKPYPVVHMEL